MAPAKPTRRSPASPSRPPAEALRCDVCDGPAYEARCKIICRRCGYTRDCSDP